MKPYKIQLRRSTDGQYYFTLNARNGKVLMTSETYTRKNGASRAIDGIETMIAYNVPLEIVDHTKPKP